MALTKQLKEITGKTPTENIKSLVDNKKMKIEEERKTGRVFCTSKK